jgi:hypothetical protein
MLIKLLLTSLLIEASAHAANSEAACGGAGCSSFEIEAPAFSTAPLPIVERVNLSIQNIFDVAFVDEGRIGSTVLHAIDGLGILMQGIKYPYDRVVKSLQPYVLFDALDVNEIAEEIQCLPNFPKLADIPADSTLSVYVFFAEAFGKEQAPTYFYGIRPKTPTDVFITTGEAIDVLTSFKKDVPVLQRKFSEIKSVVEPESPSAYDRELFPTRGDLLKFFADFSMVYAQYNYGCILYQGDGIDKDLLEAARYFKMAADQGDVYAQYDYGVMLYEGGGIKQNLPEAARYFKMAADQGNICAQYDYGIMLCEDAGIAQDFIEAERYLRMAADQGDTDAQHDYRVIFIEGKLFTKDLPEAER